MSLRKHEQIKKDALGEDNLSQVNRAHQGPQDVLSPQQRAGVQGRASASPHLWTVVSPTTKPPWAPQGLIKSKSHRNYS